MHYLKILIMEEKDKHFTMQGFGRPVPESEGSAEAGFLASSSCNRSATMVGDLAIVTSQATRLTSTEVMQNLGLNDVCVFSCYAASSVTIEDNENSLDRIVSDSNCHGPTIIAGDFNAWATEWGSKTTNRRVEVLLEAFAQINDLILMNYDTVATFTRAGRSSIIDLTFVSGLSKIDC